MNRRTFVARSAGAGLALLVGGCGASPSGGGPRTVRLGGGSFGLPSPFAYIAGIGYVQMILLYDTLLWKDAGGRLLPWLARRFERSRDGLTYTFELRDGIAWHDGRPLTAQDVAFTFDYFQRQALGPLIIAQPFGVRAARALDRLTVEVELELPAVTFLESVAGAVPIIPRHVWASIDDAPGAQDTDVLVGSGPYRLESFSLGEGTALFVANERYFLGTPFVERIESLSVDNELLALQAGEIDVAETAPEGVPDDVLAPFRADDAFGVVSQTGGFTFPLLWNLARGGALGDVRFRRACALAIDRGEIVERLVGGNGVAGNPGFLPPGHPFHADVEQYPFDPQAANRLLEQAGYRRPTPAGVRAGADGRPLRVEILVGNSPAPPFLDLLVEGLAQVGIDLRPLAVDLPTLFGRLEEGAYEMALSLYPGPGGTAPIADPDTLRTFYSSRIEGRLQGARGYVDEEFDRLARRQLVTADREQRMNLVARMQRLIAGDVPALPLYYPTLFSAFRKDVLDQWYYTPGGFAGGLPTVLNKHVLVTGSRTGLEIRRA
ncbi:MAG: ABC transporter substrate-binding protein [Actinomycetota bacterium]|jgi:peptide/nickel transport system substrate-binding protein|nr:ABC transporter substrate-binding protein [Actinomycetota bacterium]MDQ3409261.1 ABC transporter substrate-binding protein [Actinomycetota bacterium]